MLYRKRTGKNGTEAALALITNELSLAIAFTSADAAAVSPEDLTINHGFTGIRITSVNPTLAEKGIHLHLRDKNGNT